ncbi:hypothetical protein F4808DRAFT_438823, partial [Astrocystis sublimbata]
MVALEVLGALAASSQLGEQAFNLIVYIKSLCDAYNNLWDDLGRLFDDLETIRDGCDLVQRIIRQHETHDHPALVRLQEQSMSIIEDIRDLLDEICREIRGRFAKAKAFKAYLQRDEELKTLHRDLEKRQKDIDRYLGRLTYREAVRVSCHLRHMRRDQRDMRHSLDGIRQQNVELKKSFESLRGEFQVQEHARVPRRLEGWQRNDDRSGASYRLLEAAHDSGVYTYSYPSEVEVDVDGPSCRGALYQDRSGYYRCHCCSWCSTRYTPNHHPRQSNVMEYDIGSRQFAGRILVSAFRPL